MVVFRIDSAQQRICHYKCPADTHVAVSLPQLINCHIYSLPFLPALILRVERNLHTFVYGHKLGTTHPNTAYGIVPAIVGSEERKSCIRNFHTGAGWRLEFFLSGKATQLFVPDVNFHHSAARGQFSHPCHNTFCQQKQC